MFSLRLFRFDFFFQMYLRMKNVNVISVSGLIDKCVTVHLNKNGPSKNMKHTHTQIPSQLQRRRQKQISKGTPHLDIPKTTQQEQQQSEREKKHIGNNFGLLVLFYVLCVFFSLIFI